MFPNSGGFRTLVVSYFFFSTIPPLLLVGLQVEATTSNITAHFCDLGFTSEVEKQVIPTHRGSHIEKLQTRG